MRAYFLVMALRTRALCVGAAAVVGLLVAVPSTARAESSSSPTAHPRSDIATTHGWYDNDLASTITIYEPTAPAPYPALIFIHGGAWGRSQPTGSELSWARQFAEQEGWLVAVIGYPTKIRDEQVREPQAIAAALKAIARRPNVDPHRIALWGESAGGQLALVAAYRDCKTLRPLVSAVVSISGPTDMRTEYNSFAEIWLHAVTRFEGMSPKEARKAGSDRYSRTSPVDLVSRQSPATFQAISHLDPLVPANQVKVLTDRLIRADVPHRTVWLPGNGHSTEIESQYPRGSSYTVQQLAVGFITDVFEKQTVAFG